MWEHGQIAHNLYTGHGFSMHWPYDSQIPERAALMKLPPQFEGAFLPPINPYLIYYVYLLVGEGRSAVFFLLLINILISSCIPIATYRVSRLFAQENGARFSAVCAAIFLPGAYAVVSFSGSPLYQLLVLVNLYFIINIIIRGKTTDFVLAGITGGAMTLLRSEYLILGVLLIGVSSFFAAKRLGIRSVMTRSILAVALFGAVVAPCTYRNYKLFDTFVPVLSHPWFEIWRGNNPIATGTTTNSEGKSIWVTQEDFPKIIRRMDSLPYDNTFELKADTIFKNEVLWFWSNEPLKAITLGLKKLAFFFTIDFNNPTLRNPLYFISMIMIVIGVVRGLFLAVRRWREKNIRTALSIYSVFFLFYLGLTAATVMLPRYQIYVWATMIPWISFSRNKRRGEKKEW